MATLWDKVGLLRGLLSGEIAHRGPFAVTVDLTGRCNLRCVGCPFHSPILEGPAYSMSTEEDLDVGLFERLCLELSELKTAALVFCGDGEPLLHPRFAELLTAATSTGMRTVLLTNGTMFAGGQAQLLVERRLDLARVSLWTASRETYEKCYPGTKIEIFDRIVHGLRLLASEKTARRSLVPEVVLHMVINRHNFRDLRAFADLAADTGCSGISFSPMHSGFGRLSQLALPAEEAIAALEDLKRTLVRPWLRHNIDSTILRYRLGENPIPATGCYVAWLHPRVLADGTVRTCKPCKKSLGDLRRQSFREIWNGPDYRKIRRRALSPDFSERVAGECDCSFCCHAIENLRIHRYFRWISRAAKLPGSSYAA